MAKVKTNRRDGAALLISAVAHVVVIAILVSQAAPEYVLPEPPAPPMDVQIIRPTDIPPPPPPPIAPPKMTPRKIMTETPPPPAPTPPTPEPKPTPAPPTPPKPVPVKPTPPKAAPVVVAPAPPRPATPQAQPQPPQPAPPKAAPPSPPTTVPAPAKLNIHKPKEEAPASVATLPMAPSPTPASPAGPASPATGAQAPGSRLSGLTPFPLGAMPSGGTGLRGTLVGCANADSVHLSSVERAHCSERFGVEIGRAPVLDGIAPSKRAAFDKAAEAQDRSLHSGAIDPMRAVEAKHGRSTDFGGGVVTGPDSTYVHPGPE